VSKQLNTSFNTQRQEIGIKYSEMKCFKTVLKDEDKDDGQ
jgi:hypothetical protein